MAGMSTFYGLLDSTGQVQTHTSRTWSEPTNVIHQRPDWQQDAACLGTGVAPFFPERSGEDASTQAKRVCADCPVKAPCLAYALEHNMPGVWGGTSGNDRRRMKRGTRRRLS